MVVQSLRKKRRKRKTMRAMKLANVQMRQITTKMVCLIVMMILVQVHQLVKLQI